MTVEFSGSPHAWVHKFGSIADVDAGPEDLWEGDGLYAFPSSALTTTVVSSSADDAAGGTGAREVYVEGLDGNGAELTQIVVPQGATPVTLDTPLLRCYRMYVGACGSGGTNAGAIDVLHGATLLARIGAGNGQTLMAIYTTPAGTAGKRLPYMHSYYAAVGKATNVVAGLALQTRVIGSSGWRTRHTGEASDASPWAFTWPSAWALDELTDVRLRVVNVSAVNTPLTGGFSIVYR